MLSPDEYEMLKGILGKDCVGNLILTSQLKARGMVYVKVNPVMAILVLTQKGMCAMKSYEKHNKELAN